MVKGALRPGLHARRGIQLRRTKGWRLPASARSVARPTRWGNVFPVGTGEVRVSGPMHGLRAGEYSSTETFWYDLPVADGIDAQLAVDLYERDLEASLDARNVTNEDDETYRLDLVAALDELRGWDLACWCGLDAPCHRNVLLRLANR